MKKISNGSKSWTHLNHISKIFVFFHKKSVPYRFTELKCNNTSNITMSVRRSNTLHILFTLFARLNKLHKNSKKYTLEEKYWITKRLYSIRMNLLINGWINESLNEGRNEWRNYFLFSNGATEDGPIHSFLPQFIFETFSFISTTEILRFIFLALTMKLRYTE